MKKKDSFLPHSQENEMMVLGCALNGEYNYKLVAESLIEDDFYTIEHQIVFRALVVLLGVVCLFGSLIRSIEKENFSSSMT